jgi:hypothetical protein
MKKNTLLLTIIAALTPALLPSRCFSQCMIQSTQGYQVSLSLQPVELIVNNNAGGCTYKVVLQYNISFSGQNIPQQLYTLQGNINCGSQQSFFDLPNNGGTGFITSATGSHNGDCSQLTLSNFCNQVNIQIQGPGIPSQVISCTYSSLPVIISEFTVKKALSTEANSINWVQESNSSIEKYTLERSTDLINWKTISQVSAYSGGYQYFETDSDYGNAVNYYRLLLDGEEYGIISVDNTYIEKVILATYNLLGQKMDDSYKGLVVELCEDNTTQLKFK